MTEPWNLKGDYVEACNCDVTCQCLWLEPPDDDLCTVTIAWHIREGRYGDVDLSGLTAVMSVSTEEGVMLDPDTGWHVVLFIDEVADDEQRQANKIFVLLLRLIFSAHQFPPLARSVGLDDTLPLIGYRSAAKNPELTADNAGDIAKIVLETDGDTAVIDQPTTRQIREFTDQVDEITALAIESVIERDYRLTTDIRRRVHEIGDRKTDILAALSELSNKALLEIREVLVSLQETVQYAMRNAEIAANLALRDESEHVAIQ